MARVRRGDADAETALYLRFFDPVYRYARTLTGDDAIAEDVTNDVFTRAVLGLRNVRFIRVRRLRPWLLRLTRDIASDHVQHGDALCGDDELAALVGGLPEEERHVVALRYGLGCDDEEIATVLRSSVQRARELQARALRSLKHGLAPVPVAS